MPEANGSDILLDINDLTIAYATADGDLPVVKDIELQVRRGEILGIAGESGSGKTTLAVALLRLLKKPGRVVSGHAVFHPSDGKPVDLFTLPDEQLRQLRWRSIAYLPQGSMNALNPIARIKKQFEDVIVEHAPQHKGRIDEMVADLLQRVGLDPSVAEMYPHELSGGMRQRVLMAICVSLEPDLIVADEPTTALDVTIQRVILQSLGDLRDEQGVTIMVISHDMGVHAQLADRVAVMHDGRFVEVGEVRQIFKDPRDEYTRRLVDSIPTMEGTATGAQAVELGADEVKEAQHA